MSTRLFNERNAWCAWLAFVTFVCGVVARQQQALVSAQYSRAARHWVESEPLYNGVGAGFIYLPQAAVLHVPFLAVSDVLGEILWRATTIGAFALGLWRLCRLSEHSHALRLFPLATCIAMPLAYSVARNGQTTPLVAGLVMMAIDHLVRERWGRSAALLCLAMAFKPVALPFVVLFAVLHPPMRWRLIVGMLAVVLFPYLLQRPDYVTSQYLAWRESMKAVLELERSIPFAHLFRVVELLGWTVPASVQTGARVAIGGGLCGALWMMKRRLPHERYGIYLFTLTTAYLLLFNPRTENNTYSFLAPAIGLFVAETFLVERNRHRGTVMALIGLGLLGGYEVAVLVAPETPPIWLTPLMTLAFLISLVRSVHVPALSLRSLLPRSWDESVWDWLPVRRSRRSHV